MSRSICARWTACAPDASAALRRSACIAGIAAVPGNAMPRVSVMQAIVLAVPMTAQVPDVVTNLDSIFSMPALSISAALNFAQNRRQSVHAPSLSPSECPVNWGPVISDITGIFELAAPISCAGKVLSHPPIKTAASIGCALIISSVSMLMRFRYIIDVGLRNVSPNEIVGNTIGRPPAIKTPRLTASINSGICR